MFFKDFLELNTLWLSFFITSGVLFTLIVLINKASNLETPNTADAYNVSTQSPKFLLNIVFPLVCLFFFFILSLRSNLGVIAFGYFNLSRWSFTWLTVLTTAFCFSALGLRAWKSLWRVDFFGETFISIFLLCYFWFLITLTRSIFSFILFLELAGLALLIIFIRSSEQSKAESLGSNTTLSATTVLSSVLFLWTSIVTVLVMLLAIACATDQLSFQFDTLFLSKSFYISYSKSADLLLYSAVFLKMMLMPWYGIMFSFYKSLPINTFSLYLAFYYPAFLILTPLYFVPLLSVVGANVTVIWCGSLSLAVCSCAFLLTQTIDIRGALAVSSFFNTILLVTLFLV